jgi:hypothetical protein
MAARPDSALDPEGLYDHDRMQAMTRPVFTARAHGTPPPGWPTFPSKLGELASLDILGPFEDGLDGSYHVAFFLDTHSTHAWITPLVAFSVLHPCCRRRRTWGGSSGRDTQSGRRWRHAWRNGRGCRNMGWTNQALQQVK